MDAEFVYLFRHALLREAAYALQLPADRARLHLLALVIIESQHGGRPAAAALDAVAAGAPPGHALDPYAAELADHARHAGGNEGSRKTELQSAERTYLDRAAHYAAARNRHAEAAQLWARAAGHSAAAPLESLDAHYRTGKALLDVDVRPVARAHLEQAVRLAQEGGFAAREGDAWIMLARVLRLASESLEAEQTYARAMDCFKRGGVARGEIDVHGGLGMLAAARGRHADAEVHYSRALALARQMGDLAAQGSTLANVGGSLVEMGRYEQAEAAILDGLTLLRRTNNLRNEGMASGRLANLWERMGRKQDALRLNSRALEIHRQAGNRMGEGMILSNLAAMTAEAGDYADAMPLYAAALDVLREVGDVVSEGITLSSMADMYDATARPAEAEPLFERALALIRRAGARDIEASTLCSLVRMRLRQHRALDGLELAQAALAIAGEVHKPHLAARADCQRGVALHVLGRPGAEAAWRLGLGALQQIGDQFGLEAVMLDMQAGCDAAGVARLDMGTTT